jgi:hypothetical protein
MSPETDLMDARYVNENAGSWFTPATNDITLRGPLEK